MKVRKRPLVTEAWPIEDLIRAATTQWVSLPPRVVAQYDQGNVIFRSHAIDIMTIEGNWVTARAGSMLMVDSRGWLYPCDRQVFDDTYEEVLEDATAPEAATSG